MRLFHLPTRKLIALSITAVLAITGGAIVLSQQTASAAAQSTYREDCAPYDDVICFFEWGDGNGTANAGMHGRFALGTLMNRCRGMQQMDNITGSAYVRLHPRVTRAYRVTMYANPNCTGATRTIGYAAGYEAEWIGTKRFSSFNVTIFVR